MADERRPDADPEPRAAPLRARLGAALIALGLAGILWGVFHVLGSLPRPERREFAYRTTDYQARTAVHEHFLGGLVRGLAGLAVAMLGARLLSSGRGES